MQAPTDQTSQRSAPRPACGRSLPAAPAARSLPRGAARRRGRGGVDRAPGRDRLPGDARSRVRRDPGRAGHPVARVRVGGALARKDQRTREKGAAVGARSEHPRRLFHSTRGPVPSPHRAKPDGAPLLCSLRSAALRADSSLESDSFPCRARLVRARDSSTCPADEHAGRRRAASALVFDAAWPLRTGPCRDSRPCCSSWPRLRPAAARRRSVRAAWPTAYSRTRASIRHASRVSSASAAASPGQRGAGRDRVRPVVA